MTTKAIDVRYCRHEEGLRTAAALAKEQGFRPALVRVHPQVYAYLELGLSHLHEYIDEEERSYLVLRTPERLLVHTDTKVLFEKAIMSCRSPDVEIEVLLAY